MISESDAIPIVIVDDDEPSCRLLRRVLERRGYSVRDASDGRTGLDLIRHTLPHAALLDLRMPGELSGVDVIRELVADPSTADIPLIIVSASVHSDARSLTHSLGAAGFVEKPIDFEELYAMLDRVLAHRLES